MVAERDRIGAGIAKLVVDRFRDAEAAGGILAVDGDEIELPALAQLRQPARYRLASRPTVPVTEKETAPPARPSSTPRPASEGMTRRAPTGAPHGTCSTPCAATPTPL